MITGMHFAHYPIKPAGPWTKQLSSVVKKPTTTLDGRFFRAEYLSVNICGREYLDAK
jgi:hypothetical protein